MAPMTLVSDECTRGTVPRSQGHHIPMIFNGYCSYCHHTQCVLREHETVKLPVIMLVHIVSVLLTVPKATENSLHMQVHNSQLVKLLYINWDAKIGGRGGEVPAFPLKVAPAQPCLT